MSPMTIKDWKNLPETITNISAEALEDLETRLSDYTDERTAATGLAAPQQIVHVTPVLAPNAQEVGTIALHTGYRIKRLQTDRAARVRLYDTIAHRDADTGRDVAADPPPGSGCMFEAITDATHLDLPSAEDGGADSANVPMIIDNLGTNGAVTVTIDYVRTEP